MLNIRKGTHSELEKYYTLMEMDFDSEELFSKLTIHKGMMTGTLEFLVVYDEASGIDAGYVITAVKSMYGYVLLKYMGIMPWCRDQGIGVQTMRLINKRYADRQGIIAELTEFDDPDPDRMKKLRKFFNRFGYAEIESDFTVSGVKDNIYLKQLKGKTDIKPVLHRIIIDFYSRILSPAAMNKMIKIEANK